MNLLQNAVVFTKADSVIQVNISSSSMNGPGDDENSLQLLSVIVQDHGPGISVENQKRLFRPFTTIAATRNLNPKAVGIGLFTSKIICDKLGGDICCYSDGQNQGATFEFRIQLVGTVGETRKTSPIRSPDVVDE